MEEQARKVMLSGIQPSGDLHLGNYLGAVKNWPDWRRKSKMPEMSVRKNIFRKPLCPR